MQRRNNNLQIGRVIPANVPAGPSAPLTGPQQARRRRGAPPGPPGPPPGSTTLGLLWDLIQSVRELQEVVIEAPRPLVGKDSYPVPVFINRVTVTTAGTPVQGPDQEVPPGYNVVVRQRRHSGTVNGYVAFSDADTANDNRRSVLRDNDSISFRLRNLAWLWFDSDTSATNFEIIVEVAR